MLSRYDKMEESAVIDPVDNQSYPDPLTVDYASLQLTSYPKLRDVSDGDIQQFWIFFFMQYDRLEGDDLLLTMNDIPYRGLLKPGDSLFLIDYQDLLAIGSQKKPQS